MFEDTEVLQEVWDGKLPIQFSLSPHEVTTLDKPEPYFLLVPRVNYFPVIIDRVQRYLSGFISLDGSEELWLEYDDKPLKWHYPIGLLFDLLVHNEEALPWKIIVHFKKFPDKHLMHCRVIEAVESQFFQVVKEADQLKHRGQIIGNMQKRDHQQMWNGLINDRFEQFWSICRRLMDNTDENPIRHIPFRLYVKDAQHEIVVHQVLCDPLNDSGDRKTFGDLLEQLLPNHIDKNKWRHLGHGTDISLDIPLLWMCQNFSFPDNFIYICIIPVSV